MSPELAYQKKLVSWLTDRWDIYCQVCDHFGIPKGCTLGAGPGWEEILAYLTEIGLVEEFEKESNNV